MDPLRLASLLFVPLLSVLGPACSSTSPPGANGAHTQADDGVTMCLAPDGSTPQPASAVVTCQPAGEPTPGAVDEHCHPDAGPIVQVTRTSACCAAGDAAGPDQCPYNATMYGTEGDDDDCKYHVAWTSGPLCEGAGGVDFMVVATSLSTHAPAAGAYIHPEVFTTTPGDASCDDRSTHESPSTFEVFAEGPPGTYRGRIVFDAAGAWTVRFHLFESCLDVLPDSPHGHAAFHVTIP